MSAEPRRFEGGAGRDRVDDRVGAAEDHQDGVADLAGAVDDLAPPSTIPKNSGGLIRLWQSGSPLRSRCIAGSRVSFSDSSGAARVTQGA